MAPQCEGPGDRPSRGHGGAAGAKAEGCGGSPAAALSTPFVGAFSLLREKFSRAPSPDMSPASLSMLEQLMTAQAQECVFEGLSLPAPAAAHDSLAQLHLAQEAAQVRTASPCSPGDCASPKSGPAGAGQDPGCRVSA